MLPVVKGLVLVVVVVLGCKCVPVLSKDDPLLACSLDGREMPERDPALQEIQWKDGSGSGSGSGESTSFWAYVQPNVTSFYRETPPPSSQLVVPKFKGLATKFINLSPKRLMVFWETFPNQYETGRAPVVRVVEPMEARGTGSYTGHRFVMAYEDDPRVPLQRFVVTNAPSSSILVWDAFFVEGDAARTERNLRSVSKSDRVKYRRWRKTLEFHRLYMNVTGRAYLAVYPRPPPRHFMWPAEYLGQEHWITTRETHFDEMPPARALAPVRRGDDRMLEEYREDEDGGVLNMTLRVLSCAPRVLEIPDFLSPVEARHLLDLAPRFGLEVSRVASQARSTTRTSRNTWIPREASPIVHALFRRAADLMRMDESLLRTTTSSPSLAEPLQLVHYSVGQEYTAHHDFSYPPMFDSNQQARFATLLLYLNEGMAGGETTFPRWANAETFKELVITPKVGKAVLFYSLLPDGNMDDLSQHQANVVEDGEKWLVNLWVWDPVNEDYRW